MKWQRNQRRRQRKRENIISIMASNGENSEMKASESSNI